MKTRILLAGVGAAALIACTGCLSTTSYTVEELDLQGNVTKRTTTTESVVKTITASTKDKTLIVWFTGTKAGIKASTNQAEDSFMPTVEIDFKSGSGGMASIHKNQQNVDKVALLIQATRQDIDVTATGVSSSNSELTVAGDSVSTRKSDNDLSEINSQNQTTLQKTAGTIADTAKEKLDAAKSE